ncbi:MFS general substrate transporter [Aspergillus steynii IBT 23096]|uniref:MFS general substrate transporter n=1 Tax=Aspergillus steynii IBT 23096 TaxID=1392250 RepID=A0A2I2GCS5_9EURO|nr:MFS general substrate transporter [Aspergillus steynii IBT 23096]PLB50672.1 MFS general substrate transporter [Aspergillus steynii IBT 23096]
MAFQGSLFTASRTQTLTYLLAVCPFSIAFLVFINSSVSFVVTDLIGLHEGEGDAVGTLGFADELLALAACPLWGVLSDRIGVRNVCVAGYGVVALALALFVQAKNVYPQLLLGRLLFSVGGSAVSTMVTAVLPVVTGNASGHEHSSSLASNAPDTQDDFTHPPSSHGAGSKAERRSPSSRLAGFVGMCAGCGALVSLVAFLPLPARFQTWGLSPPQAIQYSYYLVALVALLVSACCWIGLRNLPGEEDKTWSSIWLPHPEDSGTTCTGPSCPVDGKSRFPYLRQLNAAITLGFRQRDIFIGYLGGFVARASSVGISLFVPLFVNHYYRASGLCGGNRDTGPSGIKESCREAYVLASILTGVSQLIALIAAPAFGFLSEKSRWYHLPLLFACLAGVIGYTAFGLLPSPQFKGPDGNAGVFLVMALLGISQIGAIVCSLAVLSGGILNVSDESRAEAHDSGNSPHTESDRNPDSDEQRPLLGGTEDQKRQPLARLKGSIAGVYSLYGGAGILLLTKVGGSLFDAVSPGAPFYIMAGFNGALLMAGVVSGLVSRSKARVPTHGA